MRPAVPAAVPAVQPDDAQLRAVAFAALAEACILAMPAQLLLTERVNAALPALPFALGFIAAFVAGTTLLFRFRRAAGAPTIAAVLSVFVALSVGGANLNVLILRVLVGVLVGFRVISLAFRDWHYPLHDEIGWGALAAGAEAALASGSGFGEWRIPLAVMVPAFFAASLASRAVTIWNEPEADPAETQTWLGRIPVAFAVFLAGVLALGATALQDGIFERLGSIVLPIASVILTVVLSVLRLVFSPIVWLLSRIHVNTQAWQRYLQNLGRGRRAPIRVATSHGALGGSLFRLLGFVLLCVLAWGLYRALRRVRAPDDTAPTQGAPRAPIVSAPLPDEVVPSSIWRRTLPADQVRRWYAQVLLALEHQQIRKDPSITPAEFAREVGLMRPEIRDHLDPLTRAYEDVRYGSLKVDGVTMRELHAHHRALIAALRRPPGTGERAAT